MTSDSYNGSAPQCQDGYEIGVGAYFYGTKDGCDCTNSNSKYYTEVYSGSCSTNLT